MDTVTAKLKGRTDNLSVDSSVSRSDSQASERTLLNMSDTELEDRNGKVKDLEKEGADSPLPQTPHVVTKDHVAPDPLARAKMLMWMGINTLATVFIVSWSYKASAIAHRPSTSILITSRPLYPHAVFISTLKSIIELTQLSSRRFFAIKPSSPTHHSANVKPPSHLSISS